MTYLLIYIIKSQASTSLYQIACLLHGTHHQNVLVYIVWDCQYESVRYSMVEHKCRVDKLSRSGMYDSAALLILTVLSFCATLPCRGLGIY